MVLRRILRRRLAGPGAEQPASAVETHPPLAYSWILSNHLAIGPMPRIEAHWQQLEQAGFQSRFSCCYAGEDQEAAPIPETWNSSGVSLPDHRDQETLEPDRLVQAIHSAERLLQQSSPTYLHCFAGRERSSLMAVALTARIRDLDIFEALDWVRRCHPAAMPIYGHLELLDQVLRQLKASGPSPAPGQRPMA